MAPAAPPPDLTETLEHALYGITFVGGIVVMLFRWFKDFFPKRISAAAEREAHRSLLEEQRLTIADFRRIADAANDRADRIAEERNEAVQLIGRLEERLAAFRAADVVQDREIAALREIIERARPSLGAPAAVAGQMRAVRAAGGDEREDFGR